MNQRQKIVQQQFLNNEEAVIKRLKQVYRQSLADIEEKVKTLQDDINRLGTMANLATDADEKAKLLSKQQSKIYQKQYQDAMKKQIGSILDNMQVEGFRTVDEYLQKCYEEAFVGTMYDLQGQGIALCFPLDQEAMVRAVQLDSPIREGMYAHFGENVQKLKKDITAQVSRGISTGMSYQQIAQQLSGKMVGTYNNPGGSLYYAMRIARTEGHRIQVQGAMDACYKAKDKGANVVKQWDATLDSRTRDSHVAVDGEIRELDEKFSNGLMFPGDPAGGAAEVCNCRCALLQRARWALDDDFTKMDNESGELVEIKAADYDDFKKKYFEEVKKQEQQNFDITEGGKYKILPFDNVDDYREYIRPEYNAQRMTHADNSVLYAADGGYIQNADGYKDINGYMRGLKDSLDNPKCQKTIDVLKRRTANTALKQDYVGYRKVSPSYLHDVLGLDTTGKLKSVGMPWEKFKDAKSAQELCDAINGLVGTPKARIPDKAVTSVSLCEKLNFFKHRPVKFEIQMPAGTKGLITTNYPESEFIAKPNSALEILGARVYNDSGKPCITIFARMIQD